MEEEIPQLSVARLALLIVVLSAPFFALRALSHAVCAVVLGRNRAYRALSPAQFARVHSYLVSTVHAAVASYLAWGAWHSFETDALAERPSRAVAGTMLLTLGYFVYDVASILALDRHAGLWSRATMVHHTAGWLTFVRRARRDGSRTGRHALPAPHTLTPPPQGACPTRGQRSFGALLTVAAAPLTR